MYCAYCPECGEKLALGNIEARGAGYGANAHHFFSQVYRHRLNRWLGKAEKDAIDLVCYRKSGHYTRVQQRPTNWWETKV